MSRAAARALAIALALTAGGCAALPRPGEWERREQPAPLAEVRRPFEVRFGGPGDAVLRVEIVAPSGARTHLSAFALERGHAFRFRPTEAGEHRWVIRAARPRGEAREVASGAFVAEDRGAPGQVVRRGDRLELEDGTPFRPLGENRFNVYDPSWSDGLTPDAYLARMAADGMNTIRIFVFSACGRKGAPPKPGCLEPALGRFDPAAARQYDAVFEAAERHGVKVVLSIFAIGFTSGDQWKGWEENPYSVDRGGPADAPNDFFTSPEAREAARARLRYVLARWGASPALLAVDLLNEPEWDGGIDERAWIPWARDLAATWREEDPWHHPVTAGPVGLHLDVVTDERAWWAAPECDIVQWHRYGKDVYDVHALARVLVETTRDTRRYGKPVLIGEFAWGGEPKPLYDHTHVGIWAASFAGAGVLAHSAPPYTEDSDEPMTPERGRRFRVLADFLARADRLGRLSPAADPDVRGAPGARALALGAERGWAVWLHGPAAGYGGPVTGATLVLPEAPAGRYRAAWIDDATGTALAVDARTHGGGRLELPAPRFVRHAAVLVERLAE